MRWFRFGSGKQQADQDSGRQQELYRELRQRFAPVPGRFAAQAAEAAQLLAGDDGIVVAAAVLHEFADGAASMMTSQGYQADRRDYRWSWEGAGPRLRSPLVALPTGAFHPHVQVAAAVTVVGTRSKQLVRVVDPGPVLVHVLELLDLITAGWEYGGVMPEADSANLAAALISAAKEIRHAMSDEPPLPPSIREQMRRNNTVDIWDPSGTRILGGFNPGKAMREALLA